VGIHQVQSVLSETHVIIETQMLSSFCSAAQLTADFGHRW